MTDAQARQLNPVVLAFVGDAVYSLYVRERLVCSSQGKAAEYQRAASKIVSAEGQSVFLAQIEPILDETEMEIFKRGRNAKHGCGKRIDGRRVRAYDGRRQRNV